MSKYLILGGTGTLGHAMAQRLSQDKNNQITVFSRSELRQKQMSGKFPHVKFVIGDIRDPKALYRVMNDHQYYTCFHFAALKHIDVMELNPEESVETNLLGSINVADAAIGAAIPHVVFSSTDKATDPINVYGQCKAISERIFLERNHKQDKTQFSVYRWGNVAGSSGSAIPLFVNQIKSGQNVTLTARGMTRFWIKIEDAVNYILETYQTRCNEPRFPHLSAAYMEDVITTIGELLSRDPLIDIVGLRPGEKMHESLRSKFHKEGEICSDNQSYHMTKQGLVNFLRPIVETL